MPEAPAADRLTGAMSLRPSAMPDDTRPRPRPLMRRYEAVYLDESGHVADVNRIAPATPFFEEAFSALARGALVATPQGPVAVEDLMPGDRVDTAESGPEVLLWKGSLTLYPQRRDVSGRPDRLLRMTADALGFQRPMQDLLLGPGAMIWSSRIGAFVAATDLVDGDTVLELTPVAPVAAFHLCLSGGRTLLVNGVALRSYAPDVREAAALPSDLLALFLALFPNEGLLPELDSPRRSDLRLKGGIAAA